ncbi:uncharacterized protein MKK02DRAFT_40842 [Dioszegia hungarica]|uniref:Uncharacterized protein n=1 Tax=Dioszegia hungarica TaxID=4972 RepID=A0AA38H1C7_9TREE|nr:uncharacterized protein MKK02DRAFT_40842 [Dioszegia hungarica]KAI9632538.1 hypothetical protein MKK02DRAFT_40842 [Dioszegia hungarica]
MRQEYRPTKPVVNFFPEDFQTGLELNFHSTCPSAQPTATSPTADISVKPESSAGTPTDSSSAPTTGPSTDRLGNADACRSFGSRGYESEVKTGVLASMLKAAGVMEAYSRHMPSFTKDLSETDVGKLLQFTSIACARDRYRYDCSDRGNLQSIYRFCINRGAHDYEDAFAKRVARETERPGNGYEPEDTGYDGWNPHAAVSVLTDLLVKNTNAKKAEYSDGLAGKHFTDHQPIDPEPSCTMTGASTARSRERKPPTTVSAESTGRAPTLTGALTSLAIAGAVVGTAIWWMTDAD